MIEVLPLKLLTEQDSLIFGALNTLLGKLHRADLPVANGFVITPPEFKLKAILEHYDFGKREVFEQSLTLVKKELIAIQIPEVLETETKNQPQFFINGEVLKSVKEVWRSLLDFWVDEIKNRLWKGGFYPGITQNLSPQILIFVKKVESLGTAFFDPLQDDSVIKIKFGKLHPNDLKKIDEIIKDANKKLFIPHQYEWIVDGGVKLIGVKPYTPSHVILANEVRPESKTGSWTSQDDTIKRSAVKVFLDLSSGFTIEREVDGVFIASEKIFDLNKPRDSFENLVFKLVESANAFPFSPILFKLADKSEGMGKVRGSLRLLHQKSLLDPMIEALDFVRHKKGLLNIHIVIPFVRAVSELMQIKRNLAVKKLMRKNSLKQWLEIAVPENIINLENYLITGLDGVVLNLDELIAHLNGFDHLEQELTFYKNEVDGLLKFLDDATKLIHKSKIPFIATGNLTQNPKVLDFLVGKVVYGVVVEKYETPSAKELLHQVEKRMVLRRSA